MDQQKKIQILKDMVNIDSTNGHETSCELFAKVVS